MSNYKCEITDNNIVFFFIGKLDTENTMKIASEIEYEIAKGIESGDVSKVVFDIKDVDFVASAFIRTCIKAAKEVGEGNFSIINSSPMIKKTFKVSGLSDVLNVS